MRTRITRAAALGAVALLALGACASNGGGGADVDAGDFPEGSTMARLADAGAIICSDA